MSLSQIALNNIGHLRRMKNRLNGDIMHVGLQIICFPSIANMRKFGLIDGALK